MIDGLPQVPPQVPLQATVTLDPSRFTAMLPQIRANRAHIRHVLRPGSGNGRTVVVCGAGPSLAIDAPALPSTHDVWATNSAVTWMTTHGHRLTHAVGIDFGADLVDDWPTPPDVTYLLASSVHPSVVPHLRAHGRTRVRWFHNFCNMPGEMELYRSGTLPSMLAIVGAPNSANRSAVLAFALGYDTVYLAGADCALADDGTFYADGRATPGENPVIVETEIEGRLWRSPLELFMSAVNLVAMKHQWGDRLVILGDTFPNALLRQGPEFLEHLPTLTPDGKLEGFYVKSMPAGYVPRMG